MLTTYVLVLEKRGSSAVRLRKQTVLMEEGFYLYVGSAKRGLEKRIERHLRKRKKHFWHIDYITSRRDVAVRVVFLSPHGECETLKIVSSLGSLFGHKLGSSDCSCPSHFVRLTANSFETIDRRLAALGLSRFHRALPLMPLAGPLSRHYNDVVMDKADDVTTGKPVLTLGQIEDALRSPLPGRPAQIRMAPVPRSLDPLTPEHQPRKAGVLLLLYPAQKGSELCLVLTRRTQSVADHKGQISLPGGAVHPDDLSLAHTALREACEEIGICTDDARLLGMLSPVYIESSDFCVQPYVAYLPHRPMFELQPDEVAEILEVPVSHFLDERNVVVEDWMAHGGSMRVPYFDVSGHKVWGATAMVLAEFTAILSGAEAL